LDAFLGDSYSAPRRVEWASRHCGTTAARKFNEVIILGKTNSIDWYEQPQLSHIATTSQATPVVRVVTIRGWIDRYGQHRCAYSLGFFDLQELRDSCKQSARIVIRIKEHLQRVNKYLLCSYNTSLAQQGV
jgi:hypothetical protein